jgi:hypothetical protein
LLADFLWFRTIQLNNCMNQNDYAQKTAYYDWLLKDAASYSHAATLTLKPYRSILTVRGEYVEHLTTIEAQRNFGLFLKRLNQNLFGNAAKRFGKSVSVLPVLEGNGDTKLFHYHCAIGNFPSHLPANAIPTLIECAWQQTPFGNEQVDVKPMRDTGWLKYMGKEIGSRNTEVVDIQNLRLPTASLT